MTTISIMMIVRGIKSGKIKFVKKHNNSNSLMCRIGKKVAFSFTSIDANISAEEYIASRDMNALINLLYDIINNEISEDERKYIDKVLSKLEGR